MRKNMVEWNNKQSKGTYAIEETESFNGNDQVSYTKGNDVQSDLPNIAAPAETIMETKAEETLKWWQKFSLSKIFDKLKLFITDVKELFSTKQPEDVSLDNGQQEINLVNKAPAIGRIDKQKPGQEESVLNGSEESLKPDIAAMEPSLITQAQRIMPKDITAASDLPLPTPGGKSNPQIPDL
jgi:hypothetical protein